MDTIQLGCISFAHILDTYEEYYRKNPRRWGTHPVLSSRLSTGQFHLMFQEHRKYEDKFFSYYRMSVGSFDELLSAVCEKIRKKDTVMKRSIEPAERLVITLRYLASGMNFRDLEFNFQVARNTIGVIVKETCETIWEALQHQEMPSPNQEMWLEKSLEFKQFTDFPNCIGSVDGKHVRIQCPPNSGSECFNYKKYFSLVLLAVSDAKYNFTAIDVGAYGREGDSTIFKNSNFYKRLKADQLCLPKEKPLTPSCAPVPFVLLGDEAFGLSKRVMKPYAQKNLTKERRIYNYRHCRARRTVECAFGILSNKWRVLHSCILVSKEFATSIVQCCCLLHNFVKKRDGFIFDDTLTCEMDDVEDVTTVGGKSNGIEVRDLFCEYFNGPGAVSWQERYAYIESKKT